MNKLMVETFYSYFLYTCNSTHVIVLLYTRELFDLLYTFNEEEGGMEVAEIINFFVVLQLFTSPFRNKGSLTVGGKLF